MVGQRVEDFLKLFNLESGDVPKVVGVFIAAKYATVAAGVVVGLRYQPFRRIVLGRSAVLRSSPWAQQQRARLFEALDRAKLQHRGTASPSSPWMQKHKSRIVELLEGAKQRSQKAVSPKDGVVQVSKIKSSLHDVRKGWKKAGEKLLKQRQLANQHKKHWLTKLRLQHTWHGWFSQKYWLLADKLESTASKSRLFGLLSRGTGLMPRTLAVGTAEGVLLAKLLVPFTAPLSLLLTILLFRKPGNLTVVSAQECDETTGEQQSVDADTADK